MKQKQFKKISVNPDHKGDFTAFAHFLGMDVPAAARYIMRHRNEFSPHRVQQANFAQNAARFRHAEGGEINGSVYGTNGYHYTPTFITSGLTAKKLPCLNCGGSLPKAAEGGSVVDFLERQNIDSSFNNRKKIFNQHFNEPYKGTSEQNTRLLNLLQTASSSQPVDSDRMAEPPSSPDSPTEAPPLNYTPLFRTEEDRKAYQKRLFEEAKTALANGDDKQYLRFTSYHPEPNGYDCINGICGLDLRAGLRFSNPTDVDRYLSNTRFAENLQKGKEDYYQVNGNFQPGDHLQFVDINNMPYHSAKIFQVEKDEKGRPTAYHIIHNGGDTEFIEKVYTPEQLKEYISNAGKKDRPEYENAIIAWRPGKYLDRQKLEKERSGIAPYPYNQGEEGVEKYFGDSYLPTRFSLKPDQSDLNPNSPLYYLSGKDVQDQTRNELVDLMNDKNIDKQLREKLHVDDITLQNLKPVIFGIAKVESNDNYTSAAREFKERLAESMTSSPSVGPFQIRLDSVSDRAKKAFGIDKEEDLTDTRKAYLAAMDRMVEAKRITDGLIKKGYHPELENADPYFRAAYYYNQPQRVLKSDENWAKENFVYNPLSIPNPFGKNWRFSAAVNASPEEIAAAYNDFLNQNRLRGDKGSYMNKVMHAAYPLDMEVLDDEQPAQLAGVEVVARKKSKTLASKKMGGISMEGYKSNSPDRWNPYNIIPSGNITMRNVNYPVLGIDNLGTTQIMYPDYHYLFPGQAVLEFPLNHSDMKPIKQNGGNVDETQRQKQWLLSYVQSPKYRERLQKEMNSKDVSAELQARLQNLRNADVHYVRSIAKQPGFTSGLYIPQKPFGYNWDLIKKEWFPASYQRDPVKHIDSKGDVYLENDYRPGSTPESGYETIPVHEFGHSLDDGGYRIPDATVQKIYNSTKPGYFPSFKYKDMIFSYENTPTEFINRLQPIRYLLQQQKIYDAKKQDFNEDFYNKMMANPIINNNTHFKDVMRSLKGTDEQKKKLFIDLMNTIAAQDRPLNYASPEEVNQDVLAMNEVPGETVYNQVAKYGGPISKRKTAYFQQGGTTPSQGFNPLPFLPARPVTDTMVMPHGQLQTHVEQFQNGQRQAALNAIMSDPVKKAAYLQQQAAQQSAIAAAKAAKVKAELDRRQKAIQTSDNAQQGSIFSASSWTPENLYNVVQGTPEKLRFFPNNVGGVGEFVDDYINPFMWLGKAAKSLGEAPLRSKTTNSIVPYFTSIGAPIVAGALGKDPLGEDLYNGAFAARTLTGQGKNLLRNVVTEPAKDYFKDAGVDMAKDAVEGEFKQNGGGVSFFGGLPNRYPTAPAVTDTMVPSNNNLQVGLSRVNNLFNRTLEERERGKVDSVAYQREWLRQYIESPQYKKMLQNEFNRQDVTDVINQRLQHLENIPVEYIPSFHDKPGWKTFGEYQPVTGKIQLLNEFNNGNLRNVEGHEATPVHEFSHAVDRAGIQIPMSTIQKIYDNTVRRQPVTHTVNNMDFDYYTYPTEFAARLKSIRYLLDKKKLYDPRTQEFPAELFDKMLDDPDIIRDANFRQVMQVLKGDDYEGKKKTFVDLMNSVTQNTNNAAIPGEADKDITNETLAAESFPSENNNMNNTQAKFGGMVKRLRRPRLQDGGTPVPDNPDYPMPNGYQPSSPQQRANWNRFLDFMQAKGIAGNTDLDSRDKKLGLYYLNLYNKANPNNQVPESFVPTVQYENYLIRKVHSFPGLEPHDAYYAFNNLSPAYLNRPISGVDNWLGSFTSKEYYPGFTRSVTLQKSDGSKENAGYDFGTNFEDYLRTRNNDPSETDPLMEKYRVRQNGNTALAAAPLGTRKVGGNINYQRGGSYNPFSLFDLSRIPSSPTEQNPPLQNSVYGMATMPKDNQNPSVSFVTTWPPEGQNQEVPPFPSNGYYSGPGAITRFFNNPLLNGIPSPQMMSKEDYDFNNQSAVTTWPPTGPNQGARYFPNGVAKVDAGSDDHPDTAAMVAKVDFKPGMSNQPKSAGNTTGKDSTTTVNNNGAQNAGQTTSSRTMNPFYGLLGLSGLSFLNNLLENSNQNRSAYYQRVRNLSDSFAPIARNSRGDYSVNEGYFRPNQYVPVQFSALPTAQLGGGYFDAPLGPSVNTLLNNVGYADIDSGDSLPEIPGNPVDESSGSAPALHSESSGSLPSNIQANTNVKLNPSARRAFDYYVNDKGLAPHIAAGIVGNLVRESGVDPKRKQNNGGPGRGAAQWTQGDRWDNLLAWSKKKDRNPYSLYTQLDYILEEPGWGPEVMKALAKTQTPEQASYIFGKLYERPANKSAAWDIRAGAARKLYNEFQPAGRSKEAPANAAALQPMYPNSFAPNSYTQGLSGIGLDSDGEQVYARGGTANPYPIAGDRFHPFQRVQGVSGQALQLSQPLFYQQGGEYIVTPKQLEFIMAHGGEVEFL